ncbi:MAG: hypothetical protein KBG92_00620 [Spirochaetes bacterium]|nr:hypothetical protein [Spirochaetota bacterium]
MKNYIVSVIAIICVVMMSISVQSQHLNKKHADTHKAQMTMGKLILKAEKLGVTVEGYLNDIDSAMQEITKSSGITFDKSNMNPDITHHISFFITVTDKTGDIKNVMLTFKHKKQVATYMLMDMKNHYGSDVSLKLQGTYTARLVLETQKKGKIQFDFTFSI